MKIGTFNGGTGQVVVRDMTDAEMAGLPALAQPSPLPASNVLADTKTKLHQAASVWTPVTFTFTKNGQYIKFDTGVLTPSSNYGWGYIPVTPGEVLQITQTTVGLNTALLVWYDAADRFIGYEEQALSGVPQTYTDYPFIVPPNAAKLGVTTNGATPIVKRGTFDADLAQTVATVESAVTTVAALENIAAENTAAVSTFATITPAIPWSTGGFLSMADGLVKTNNTVYGYQFYTVTPNEPLLLSGGISGSTTALALWYDTEDNYLGFSIPAPSSGSAVYSDRLVVAPTNAVKLGMTQHGGSLRATSPVSAKRATRVLGMPARLTQLEADVAGLNPEVGYWAGKTVAWFGNSVPYGNSVTGANYPSRIAAALGFNLTVEATPGMSFRGGVRSNVTGGDAYGITGKSWTNVAWSMAMSLAEKQDLIANWQSKWRALLVNDPPATLSSSQQAQMLDTSYENRLIARHLGANRKDWYIFDNPFNDRGMADDLETAGNDGGEDRLTYLGAMNFLIRLIKKDNPYAKIAIVGHYENQRPGRNGIAESQQMVAERWLLPILPLHKHLGWSQEAIDVNGSWTAATGGYTWTAGTGVQTMTMLERVLPDGTHPAQDNDGRALDAIVDVITPWMRQLR